MYRYERDPYSSATGTKSTAWERDPHTKCMSLPCILYGELKQELKGGAGIVDLPYAYELRTMLSQKIIDKKIK